MGMDEGRGVGEVLSGTLIRHSAIMLHKYQTFVDNLGYVDLSCCRSRGEEGVDREI